MLNEIYLGGLVQTVYPKVEKNNIDALWIALYQAYFKNSIMALALASVFALPFALEALDLLFEPEPESALGVGPFEILTPALSNIDCNLLSSIFLPSFAI